MKQAICFPIGRNNPMIPHSHSGIDSLFSLQFAMLVFDGFQSSNVTVCTTETAAKTDYPIQMLSLMCCPCRKNRHEQLDDSHITVNGAAPPVTPDHEHPIGCPHVTKDPISYPGLPSVAGFTSGAFDNPALNIDEPINAPMFNTEVTQSNQCFDFRSILGDSSEWFVPELPFLTKSTVANATDPAILESQVFKFPRSDLVYLSEVGNTWFGKILRAEALAIVPGVRKSIVLVCQLKDTATVAETAAFLSHAQPFRELDHANILPLLGQCIEQIPRLLIYEHCSKGSLKAHLTELSQTARQSDETGRLIFKFAAEISDAVSFMHTYKLYYPDIATHSCVVDFDDTLKLGDYGFSHEIYPEDYYVSKGAEGGLYPLRWIDPQSVKVSGNYTVIEPIDINQHTNIWSLSCTMWEIVMFGEQPYTNLSDSEVMQQVVAGPDLNLPQIIPRWHFIPRINELLEQGWQKTELRPNAKHYADSLMRMLTNYDREASEFFEKKWKESEPTDANPNEVSVDVDCIGAMDSLQSSVETSQETELNIEKYELNSLALLQTTFIETSTISGDSMIEPLETGRPAVDNSNVNKD